MSSEPTEAELLRRAIENRLLDLHTSLPAVVESYDRSKQTVDVRLAVKRAIASDDQTTSYEEIPILRNVRVKFPLGRTVFGGATARKFFIAWPLQKGDPVDVIFDEQYVGDYRESGTVPSSPIFTGRFNLSSAYAIPGGGANSDAIVNLAERALILGIENGPQIQITMGGELGDEPQILLGPDIVAPVARADKVAMQVNKIIDLLKGWTVVANDGGAALKTAANSLWPSDPISNDFGAETIFAK